jgi:hypothetical protein
MRLLTIAVVLLLALAGASCGGDDEESSGDEDTITLETTTDDTTTDETTTDDETTDDDDSGGSLASEECQELVDASAALGQSFSGAESGDDLSESSEAFAEFAENAPDEIRSDLEIMAETYAAYVEAIEDTGLDPGETPSPEQAVEFQQALASIDLEEFTAASQRFSTWATSNCQG